MAVPRTSSLYERILSYASVSIIIIAVLSYLTTLVVALLAGREALSHGLWQLVTVVSYLGLPIGFVLLITLLATSFLRRSKPKRTHTQQ